MSSYMNTFYKYNRSDDIIVELYFDDLMFYSKELRGRLRINIHEYQYSNFLRFYMGFTDSMLRLLEREYAVSISRRIYTYMKDHDLTMMPIHEVAEFLEKDVIVYIIKNNMFTNLASPYPKVEFGRAYDNPKKDTFDHITVTFSMLKRDMTPKEIIAWIELNKKHMQYILITSIKPKLERKYGIPINYIKVDSCILTTDCCLVYKLSLKNIDI